jgi:hypothetical protein
MTFRHVAERQMPCGARDVLSLEINKVGSASDNANSDPVPLETLGITPGSAATFVINTIDRGEWDDKHTLLTCLRDEHDTATLTSLVTLVRDWTLNQEDVSSEIFLAIPGVVTARRGSQPELVSWVNLQLVLRKSSSFAVSAISNITEPGVIDDLNSLSFYFTEWGPGDTRVTLAQEFQRTLGEGVVLDCKYLVNHKYFSSTEKLLYHAMKARGPALGAWLAIHGGLCPLCVDKFLEVKDDPGMGTSDIKTPGRSLGWETKKERATRKKTSTSTSMTGISSPVTTRTKVTGSGVKPMTLSLRYEDLGPLPTTGVPSPVTTKEWDFEALPAKYYREQLVEEVYEGPNTILLQMDDLNPVLMMNKWELERTTPIAADLPKLSPPSVVLQLNPNDLTVQDLLTNWSLRIFAEKGRDWIAYDAPRVSEGFFLMVLEKIGSSTKRITLAATVKHYQ